MREDWIEVEVCELCEVVRGGSPRPAGDLKYYNGNIPFLKVADLTSGTGVFLNEYTYTIKEAGLKKTRLVDPPTLLLSNSGATLGIPRICNFQATFNDGIAAFLGLKENTLSYHYYFWLSKTRELRNINQGAAQPNLNTGIIGSTLIPLAPLPIQRAIVSKIEALFSDLDNGIANFKKAQAQLKIYRQAVLKKAFEGGFTSENEEGITLPKGWNLDRIGDVVKTIDGDRGKNYPNKNELFDSGYCLFLSTKNVRQGYFVFEDNIFITKEKDEILRGGKVQLNDVIITTRGTLGNVALFNEKTKYKNIRINSGMLLLRIKDNNVLQPNYLMKFITSTLFFNQLKSLQTGTAQPQIPANILREIKIAYPKSLQEQTQIIQEIEFRLSVCDKMEQSITESIAKAEALRQSILKKAFEGKLLSQAEIDLCKKEADYEPAGELLKKIKTEKLAKEQAKKQPSIKNKTQK